MSIKSNQIPHPGHGTKFERSTNAKSRNSTLFEASTNTKASHRTNKKERLGAESSIRSWPRTDLGGYTILEIHPYQMHFCLKNQEQPILVAY